MEEWIFFFWKQNRQDVSLFKNRDTDGESGSNLHGQTLYSPTPRTSAAGRNSGSNFVAATKVNRENVKFSEKNFEEL